MSELGDVLVVEDNQQNLELVEYLLEERGIAVRSASDAEGVLAQLAERTPDLILMDMQLPGTDGLTLVRRIRRDPEQAGVVIVALTAHAMRGDRERFLAGGCDGYIAKPIDAVNFVDHIRTILASRTGGETDAPGPP